MILRIPIGAFLLTPETKQAMESLREDRLFFRTKIEIQDGGIEAAVPFLTERRTPPLLIVETSAAKEQLFQQLEGLANVCDPETKLIMIGVDNDIGLYRELIQGGVSDYLIGPVNAEQIRDSIRNVYAGVAQDDGGRVITVAGVTGGIGSSVIAHNIAFELAETYEEQVILVDVDISFGTAALNFNQQPRQSVLDALSQSGQLDASLLGQFFTELGENLSLLPSPASLTTGVQISTDAYDRMLGILKTMAEFIVIDLPHVWEPWTIDAFAATDELVLISRPDLMSLRNGKNMIEYIGPKRGVDAPTRLALNQVGAAKRADLTGKDFTEALALTPTVSIPYDAEAFGRALNNGEMMSKASAKSKATKAIIDLTKIVSGRADDDEAEGKKGFSLFKKAKKKD